MVRCDGVSKQFSTCRQNGGSGQIVRRESPLCSPRSLHQVKKKHENNYTHTQKKTWSKSSGISGKLIREKGPPPSPTAIIIIIIERERKRQKKKNRRNFSEERKILRRDGWVKWEKFCPDDWTWRCRADIHHHPSCIYYGTEENWPVHLETLTISVDITYEKNDFLRMLGVDDWRSSCSVDSRAFSLASRVAHIHGVSDQRLGLSLPWTCSPRKVAQKELEL